MTADKPVMRRNIISRKQKEVTLRAAVREIGAFLVSHDTRTALILLAHSDALNTVKVGAVGTVELWLLAE